MRGQLRLLVPCMPSTDHLAPLIAAMTAAQSRLAETIETFYGSADKASDGAMAGHAYKRSVDDLDGSVGRELVSLSIADANCPASISEICDGNPGSTLPDDHF